MSEVQRYLADATPGPRIELHQSGGISGKDRAIVLAGDRIAAIDAGTIRSERRVEPEELEEVTGLLADLERDDPKTSYGRSPISDAMRWVLSYAHDGDRKTIEVSTDPSDSPPETFRALVSLLRSLAR
jgi:hypothetical protein